MASRCIGVLAALIAAILNWAVFASTGQANSVVAWGDDGSGQCDVPLPNQDFTAIAGGQIHSLGLKKNGSIVAWGGNLAGQCNVPSPNSGFIAVGAGLRHSLGLKTSGAVFAWGSNHEGQCNVPGPNQGFIAIASGPSVHSLALKADGSIVAWGRNVEGQCDVPEPNLGFVAITTGGWHSLGIRADGSIAAWGRNDLGQCDVPLPNESFVAVAAGYYHSVALKADGSVVAWGRNYYGECDVPMPNEGFVAIAAGARHSLGLKADGSVVAWGINNLGQCFGPLEREFTTIAAGSNHNLALLTNLPVVHTRPVGAVTQNSAALYGEIETMGDCAAVDVHFQYRPTFVGTVVIANPYAGVDFATYYKSNFHTHTTRSDGSLGIHDVISRYANKNYRILALTDHDHMVTPETTWPWTHWIPDVPSLINYFGVMETSAYYPTVGSGMLAVRGNELSHLHHTGSLFNDLGYASAPASEYVYMTDIAARGGMAMLYHPGRYDWTVQQYVDIYAAFEGTLHGMEVYNQCDRYSNDRALWDAVNSHRSMGEYVWGYSNDDMHVEGHLYRNYNLHYMAELTEGALRENLLNGASTFSWEGGGSGDALAPVLTNVSIEEPRVTIDCSDCSSIIWYSDTTEIIFVGATLNVTDRGNGLFARAVMVNPFGRTYTQPFGYHVDGEFFDWIDTPVETMTEPGEFTYLLEGLSPGTSYDFRAVAHCQQLARYGEVLQLATDPSGQPGILGDINGDGCVDHADLALLLAAYGTQPGDPNWNAAADINGDGTIGHADLAILLHTWGEGC